MDENSKRLKSIYVGQIVNRILVILCLLIMIANLVAVIIAGVRIKQFTQMIQPAVDALSELDVEELNKTLSTFNTAVDVLKIDETLEAIGKIDFEGFSKVVSEIDVDKLNDTLDAIDGATEFLNKMGSGLKSLLGQFGIDIGK